MLGTVTLPRLWIAIAAASLAAGLGCSAGPRLTLSPQPVRDLDCKAPEGWADLKIRKVAVLDFADSTERREGFYQAPAARVPPKPIYLYQAGDGALAGDAAEHGLIAEGKFEVVERRVLARLLEEQKLQMTGLIEAAQAVRAGRMAAADAVLMGRVDHAYAGYENKTAGGSWVGTYTGHAALSLRLVHVESGRVAWACQLSRSSLQYLDKPLTLSTGAVLKDPHAYDAPLFGATPEERLKSILRRTVRDAVARLSGTGPAGR